MSYFFYNLFLAFAFCAALPLLPLLSLLGKRFSGGLAQRLGWYPKGVRHRLAGVRPIWIHAASVGEARAAKVLIEALRKRFPERRVILSTFTQPGNAVAQKRAGDEEVIFLPLDFAWTVRRSLNALNPALLVLIETEIWPNLLWEAQRRKIPALLVSGRISARAFRRYQAFLWLFRDVLRTFRVLGMQSEADGARIIRLGADPSVVQITGNLKQAAAGEKLVGETGEFARAFEPPATGEKRGGWLWVVGSTHPGEEEIVLAAFGHLKKYFPALRMVLAPRHPHRFREVEKLLLAHGWRFEKKSQVNGKLVPEEDVMILDTLGDLERLYAVGDVAFVGGSLVNAGCHNLLEPARFRKPVLFGPHTSNVAALARDLIANGGGIQVRGCEDLVREITALLAEPERCKAVGTRAFQVASKDRGVLEGSLDVIAPYLES